MTLLALLHSPAARGQTFVPTAGTNPWNVDANWTPAAFPNAAGAGAVFPSPTAALTVPLNQGITVGTVSVTNNAAAVLTPSPGTGGSLTFNNGGAEATLTAAGTSSTTNNLTVSAPVVLAGTLRVNSNNTGAPAAATSAPLTFTGAVTGPGDFVKDGPARMSFTTAAKAYTGATLVDQGRVRVTLAGLPTGTSAVTVAAGGQLALDNGGAGTTFAFGGGTVPVTLSGAGAEAALPGALRLEGSGTFTTALPNPVALAAASTVHVDGATRTLQFTGAVSGAGPLTKSGTGVLELTQAGTHSGGTAVTAGVLRLSGATASLGAGGVTVTQDATTTVPAVLDIQPGVLDGVSDLATLSLSGGGASATAADDGHALLGAGVNEVVAGLTLGGVVQTAPGTYGSTASAATFQSDEYFAGAGVVTLAPVPEPAGVLLAAGAALGLARVVRRRALRMPA